MRAWRVRMEAMVPRLVKPVVTVAPVAMAPTVAMVALVAAAQMEVPVGWVVTPVWVGLVASPPLGRLAQRAPTAR